MVTMSAMKGRLNEFVQKRENALQERRTTSVRENMWYRLNTIVSPSPPNCVEVQ